MRADGGGRHGDARLPATPAHAQKRGMNNAPRRGYLNIWDFNMWDPRGPRVHAMPQRSLIPAKHATSNLQLASLPHFQCIAYAVTEISLSFLNRTSGF